MRTKTKHHLENENGKAETWTNGRSQPTTTPERPPQAVEEQKPPAASEANQTISSVEVDEEQVQLLVKIFILLLVIVLLVNVPISGQGLGLGQSAPESTAVIYAEGSILRGGGTQVYALQDHRLRPFSSVDTFNYFQGRAHLQVTTVPDEALNRFAIGPPIYHLVSCRNSRDVYALEDGYKRLIIGRKADDTVNNRWDQVNSFNCTSLEQLSDGSPLDLGNSER